MYRTRKGIMIALAIGDGSLEKSRTDNGVRLKIEHGEKQLAYLEHKKDLLYSVLGGKNIRIHTSKRERKGTKLTSYWFRKGHRYFRTLRKWLYPNGEKQLTRRILDKLTPEGLAIWYMDDGNLYNHINKDSGLVTSFRITLSTEVPLDEAEMIRDYFEEKWSITFHINKTKNNRYRHRCSTKEARKFFDIIAPYIIDSMKYKINVPDYLRHEC